MNCLNLKQYFYYIIEKNHLKPNEIFINQHFKNIQIIL